MSRAGKDPNMDWAIILCVGVLLALILGSVGLQAFFDVSSRLSSGSASTVASHHQAAFDSAALGTVLRQFDQRAAEHDNALHGKDVPNDPSL